MDWLIYWVSQIMLYIILATCVDLVIPANQMKQYVTFVLKIFLLSIYLQPLFLLFSVNHSELNHWLDHVLNHEEQAYTSMKRQMDEETNDIQQEQFTALVEKIEAEWQTEANAKIAQYRQVTVTNVSIQTKKQMLSFDAIDLIIATIDLQDNSAVRPIEQITWDQPEKKRTNNE